MVDDRLVTVLVVDDEPDILDATAELLSENLRNARVVTAASGRAALDMLADHRPHIVLSDYRMEHVNGLEVLRTASLHHAAVTMMMTAYPDLDVAVAALKAARVSRFFVKPPDPDELVAAMQGAVDAVVADAARATAFERVRRLGDPRDGPPVF